MGTLADKLNKIKETKDNIKAAIIEKGVDVTDTDTFASYPDKIKSITSGDGYLGVTAKYAYGGGSDLSILEEDAKKYIINGKYMFLNVDITDSVVDTIKIMNIGFSDLSYMFYYSKIKNFKDCVWDTSKITSFDHMFYYCQDLKNVDMSNLDFSECRSVAYMFYMCNNPASGTKCILPEKTCNKIIDFSYMFYNSTFDEIINIKNLLPTNASNTSYTFNGVQVTELDLSTWGENKITNMSYMFNACRKLATLDISNLETSSVTNMSYMFNECNALTSIDVSKFDTKNVTTMEKMFYNCKVLNNIVGINNFDTTKVTDMDYMFYGCASLENVDIDFSDCLFSGTGKSRTSMEHIFSGAKIKSVKFPSGQGLDFYRMLRDATITDEVDLGGAFMSAPSSSALNFVDNAILYGGLILPNFQKVTSTTTLGDSNTQIYKLKFGEGNTFGNESTTASLILSLVYIWKGAATKTITTAFGGGTYGERYEEFANSIAANTSGKTRTIKLNTSLYNSLTDEQKALLTDKGYTLSYGK